MAFQSFRKLATAVAQQPKSIFATSLSVVFLSACGGGGGGGGTPVAANSCEQPKAAFSALQKVQLEADSAAETDGTNPRLGLATDQKGEVIVKANSQLTVVVRNSCSEPGEITSGLQLNPAFAGKDGVHSYPYTVNTDIARSELEAKAKADACVQGISNSTVSYADALPNDPLIGDEQHMQSLQADESYPIFYDAALGKRRSVVIAIIDTGVDIDHEDLKDVLWKNSKEIPGNNIDDDGNGYVDDVNGYDFADSDANPRPRGSWKGNHHGTHVAGLAAAHGYNQIGVSGVMAAGARVMALNVFGDDPGALSYHTENAIRYAADNGADVINMSIGGKSASASYQDAIAYAVSKGVTVLAAAGNEGRLLGTSYFLTPGSYGKSINGMLAIGSIDSSDGGISSFSNYSSSFVELGAPGSEDTSKGRGLLSTYPGNKYRRLMGTSMATPVAAGAAGLAIQLMRARGYAATPARVEIALRESANNNSSLESKISGGKVLNLKGLADYITKNYPLLAQPEPGSANSGSSKVDEVTVPCS